MRKLLTVLAMIGTFATPAIASDHSAVQNDRTALPQQGSESFAKPPEAAASVTMKCSASTEGLTSAEPFRLGRSLSNLQGEGSSRWKRCFHSSFAKGFAGRIECLHGPAIIVALAARWTRARIGNCTLPHVVSGKWDR